MILAHLFPQAWIIPDPLRCKVSYANTRKIMLTWNLIMLYIYISFEMLDQKALEDFYDINP